jgi:hypothetical protein
MTLQQDVKVNGQDGTQAKAADGGTSRKPENEKARPTVTSRL